MKDFATPLMVKLTYRYSLSLPMMIVEVNKRSGRFILEFNKK